MRWAAMTVNGTAAGYARAQAGLGIGHPARDPAEPVRSIRVVSSRDLGRLRRCRGVAPDLLDKTIGATRSKGERP
jgi:hypothetical protein